MEDIVKTGSVEVRYQIVAVPYEGGFVYDFDTDADAVYSPDWFETPEEAERYVRRELGSR